MCSIMTTPNPTSFRKPIRNTKRLALEANLINPISLDMAFINEGVKIIKLEKH